MLKKSIFDMTADEPEGKLPAITGGPPPDAGETNAQGLPGGQSASIGGMTKPAMLGPSEPKKLEYERYYDASKGYTHEKDILTDGRIDMARRAANVAPNSYLDINGNVNIRGIGTTQEWNPSMGQFRYVPGTAQDFAAGGGFAANPVQIDPNTNLPIGGSTGGGGTPNNGGGGTQPDVTQQTNFRGRTVIGASGTQRQVREDGAILDAQGNPQGDGLGNLLNVNADGTIMAGSKPWGYIQANGQVRQGLRPAAGSPDTAQGTGMNFRGRTIIGISGVPRQVDQQGRILSNAGGGYQLAEDGSELIVGENGIISAGGKQWGYLDAQGRATKSSTGGGGTPNNGGQGKPIAAQAGLISPEMLVENRVANMMKSGNPILEQALTRAKQIANERGTLNSSMAAQAGTEAMLSASREIATQDANTLKDAALTEYKARIEQIMQDKSLSSAEKENALQREFQRSENALQRSFQQSEGALNRAADVDAREFQARIQQIMQDKSLSSAEKENALQREFQQSEGAAQRLFQGDLTREGWRLDSEKDTLNYQRNIANFERQIAATKDEGDRNFFRTMQQNYNQSILTLQTDPNMTPEQRSAQIAAMNSIFAGFTYNGAFLNMVKPAGSTTTGTGENTGTSGGGSGGGSGGTDSDKK